MPKLENGINGSFRLNGIPHQKGIYEPVVNSSLFGIRRVGTRGADSDFIALPQDYSSWTDNTDTPFATMQDLLDYLEAFFFRETASSLTPDDQVVGTYALLPDANLHEQEVWFIQTQTGNWFLGTRRQSGYYIALSGVWVKTNDPLQYFTDDQLTFKDDLDQTKQLGFQISDISTGVRRIATWPNKNGIVAMISDLLANQIIVTQANAIAILGGTIDSTKEYFLDGIIDMGVTSIEVPAGGINIKGFDFNVSKLTSSEDNYTMFTSPIGGSGDVLGSDYAIEVTGLNSKVYDIVDSNGFHAFEFSRVNYNDCSALGVIDSYRQGLETGTGRFGGKPELELKGAWLGGYFIDTSIVRSLVDGSYSLFKSGVGFVMNSRFRSNQNIDLNTNVSFFDFTPVNFPNPSTVQLDACLISRNGVFDVSDPLIIPNITQKDVESTWKNNIGIVNTYVGGLIVITVEVVTIISIVSTWYTLLGTWLASGLHHFDSPANGQLRHIGTNTIEFKYSGSVIIEGSANDDISVKLVRWNDDLSTFTDIAMQSRQINNLVGGRNVAVFTAAGNLVMNQNDYVFLQIRNNTGIGNLTAEIDSFFTIEER